MGLPFYLSELPDTDFADGHVCIHMERDHVTTLALYRTFLEREIRKLNEWDRRHTKGEVLPFRRAGESEAH